jgi:hypothetical protein
MACIEVGGKIEVLNSREYESDTFTVTRKRKSFDSFVIDAMCDGDESICISVNIDEVMAIDG